MGYMWLCMIPIPVQEYCCYKHVGGRYHVLTYWFQYRIKLVLHMCMTCMSDTYPNTPWIDDSGSLNSWSLKHVQWVVMSRARAVSANSPCETHTSYAVSLATVVSQKSAHPLLWSNFLYRLQVYSNEHPPWSELCVTKRASMLVKFEKLQALCIPEVGKFMRLW